MGCHVGSGFTLFLVSLVFLFSVSLTVPSLEPMPDLLALFLSQLVVKPQLEILALLLVLFHTSLFPQIFYQSLSLPRLAALAFLGGDPASVLGSCQRSAGSQYWTTMTRCSPFSLAFLFLGFCKLKTGEEMPGKIENKGVEVTSSQLSYNNNSTIFYL